MKLRRSAENGWFYGCAHWPDCNFTFDADQSTGAPIPHTRYGIPFRAPIGDGHRKAFFAAIKRNEFDPEAGRRLEEARIEGGERRKKAVRNLDRAKVWARIQKAAPQTRDEWLAFVLSERQIAIQDDRDDAARRIQMLDQLTRNPRKR